MKGLLATGAVLGALAIGGLPVLALTLASDGTGVGSSAVTDHADRPGPPAWSHGHARGHHEDAKEGKEGKEVKGDRAAGRAKPKAGKDGHERGWAKQDRSAPPGWARHRPGQTPHGWAMRAWAACVGDAAARTAPGEKLDPQAACGPRPAPPTGPGGSEGSDD